MSCWVVPSVAAELWGVSVEHVLAGIREGRIFSRTDNGFVCVDAAPESPTLSAARVAVEHPPTFTVVTEDEMAALLGGNGEDRVIDDYESDAHDSEEEREDPEETSPFNWRD